MKFAVIETGGKQYKVTAGQKLQVEKIPGEPGISVSFDRVLLTADGGEASIGAPYLKGATVEAEILRQGRGEKKIVFRFHSKTRYRKKKGHRQHFTEVQITKL